LTGESAVSCAPIAEKLEQILETSGATAGIFAKILGIAEAMSANIVRIGARALRRLSYEQIGRKSAAIRASFAPIAAISVEIFVVDAATCATIGRIAGKLAETKANRDVFGVPPSGGTSQGLRFRLKAGLRTSKQISVTKVSTRRG
jgi:hypothetical protein